jgi:hypothetical protein
MTRTGFLKPLVTAPVLAGAGVIVGVDLSRPVAAAELSRSSDTRR